MFNTRPSFRGSSTTLEGVWTITLLSTLSFLATSVSATVVCSDCRPLALQEAPAIGMSLAPGYGAVSVQFVNGTTSDVALVHGGEDYINAMSCWQQLGSTGKITNLQSSHTGDSKTNVEGIYLSLVQSWMRNLCQAVLRKFNMHERSSNEPDHNLGAIADMMAKLFQSAKESVALEHNKVFLAVPDFVVTTNPSFSRPIKSLLQQAQVETFGMHYQRQSQEAFSHLYGLADCFGIPIDEDTEVPDTECEEYNGRSIQTVLFVAVDGISLTLRSMLREDGMFYGDLGAAELLWKHGEVEDDIAYLAWVDRRLGEFLESQDATFDLLLLSGTKATAGHLQEILQDRLKREHNIRPEDYLRSDQDHAFAAARGAAASARRGMCNDFEACLPNSWCRVSEHCSQWAWYREVAGREEAEVEQAVREEEEL